MTCWQCYLEMCRAEALDKTAETVVLDAVVIADGSGLCAVHAYIHAQEVNAEANSSR